MNLKITLPIIFTGCLLCLLTFSSALLATPEEPAPSSLALFSNEKRPQSRFDHDLHEQSLEDGGCALCHHVYDEVAEKLVYIEGEEMACSECHFNEKKDDILSFRDANHASCTVCHRTLIKSKKPSGPTTCGECHQK